MWLFLLTVIMIFGSLTSAYLVNRSFLSMPIAYMLPSVFSILKMNLLVIILSSVPMQLAVWAGKKGDRKVSIWLA